MTGNLSVTNSIDLGGQIFTCPMVMKDEILSVIFPGGFGNVGGISSTGIISDKSTAAVGIPINIDGITYSISCGCPAPIDSGYQLGNCSAPVELSDINVVVQAPDYKIEIDGIDVTKLIESCTLTTAESSLFDTVQLTIPDGTRWKYNAPPSTVVVTLYGIVHTFGIDEMQSRGIAREIWGRPASSALSEPVAATSTWNERNNTSGTLSALAASIASPYSITWTAADFPVPPAWEISGAPAAALQAIATAAGALVDARASGNIIIRKKWPVRSVDIKEPVITISRDNALDLSIEKNSDSSIFKSVTVHGYSPEISPPDIEVEGSPVFGKPAYIRLYWPSAKRPWGNAFVTSGSTVIAATTDIEETITDTVVFIAGKASASYPVLAIYKVVWIGTSAGDVSCIDYGREFNVANEALGIATITYQTAYTRHKLTGQAVTQVLWGVTAPGQTNSAEVVFTSGERYHGDIENPFLATVAACINHGIATLDDGRIAHKATATLPYTADLHTGQIAAVQDNLLGFNAVGKISSITTNITPTRITQQIEVSTWNS